MKAIGLKFVPYDEKKHLKSHFFGPLLAPKGLDDDLYDSTMFLGMIHLPEIASMDKGNKLPHEGYLYFFLDTEDGYRKLKPIVKYSDKEPEFIIDDFNDELTDEYPGIDKPVGIEFVEVDEEDEGCKLLGYPCDWNYENPPKTPLLLSISHFDEELNFLPHLDGYTYVFFGPKGHEFDGAYGFYEYS